MLCLKSLAELMLQWLGVGELTAIGIVTATAAAIALAVYVGRRRGGKGGEPDGPQ